MIFTIVKNIHNKKQMSNYIIIPTCGLIFPFLSSKGALIEIGSEEIHGFVSWKHLQ
jgi:hypothetical protein